MPTPVARLISPTGRRITEVEIGSTKSSNLKKLGWRLYTGPGEATAGFDGTMPSRPGKVEHVPVDADKDPRNGWLIPESDPNVKRVLSPAGSFDQNPSAANLLTP